MSAATTPRWTVIGNGVGLGEIKTGWRADIICHGDDRYDLAERVAAALNAANPGLDPKFCPICMAAFHADGTVTPHAADPAPEPASERT